MDKLLRLSRSAFVLFVQCCFVLSFFNLVACDIEPREDELIKANPTIVSFHLVLWSITICWFFAENRSHRSDRQEGSPSWKHRFHSRLCGIDIGDSGVGNRGQDVFYCCNYGNAASETYSIYRCNFSPNFNDDFVR